MKKTARNGLMVVLGVLILLGTLFASGGDAHQPKPAQDIIEALAMPPAGVFEQYGFTAWTRVIYNIAALADRTKDQEARIKALEAKVAELSKPVVEEVVE
jgi:hypothetical protein